VKEFARLRSESAVSAAIVCLAVLHGAVACPECFSDLLPHPQPYREVTDEVGRSVRIPQPVRRIVSLAPSLTETIYALGLQDRLVGDNHLLPDYPPDAPEKDQSRRRHQPKFGTDCGFASGSRSRDQGIETASRPRMRWKAWESLPTTHTVHILIPSEEIITFFEKNFPTYSAFPKQAHRSPAKCSAGSRTCNNVVGALAAKRVLFVVWTQPLISVGKDTFIADALRRAGAVSIVDSDQGWPQVSLEEVARLQPEFLVFPRLRIPNPLPPAVEVLATLPGWSIVDAVSNRRFAVISDGRKSSRPADRHGYRRSRQAASPGGLH